MIKKDTSAFRLTRQRIAILKLLQRYFYLRTSHLYDLLSAQTEGSQRAIRRMLHDFWQHGYLERELILDHSSPDSLPRFETVYWPSRLGEAVGKKLAPDVDIVWRAEKSPHTLDHEMSITEFHLAVERFARRHDIELYWQRHDLRRTVNPDALFALTELNRDEEENTFYYFLEVERSRQGNYRNGESGLMRKLEKYFAYQSSSECLNDWKWFDEFRVIVILKNEIRQRNLLERLKSLQSRMFWTTTENSDLQARVFLTPYDYETHSYSLFD